MRRADTWLLLATVLLLSPPTAKATGLRNVLLVSIDSLRADHLGCYGYRRDTSPTIDRLAAEGIRFEYAESPSSWTLPAHASLLTGVAQWRHQATQKDQGVSEDVLLLAEILGSYGFHTAGFYSGPYVDPAFGFGRGFDEYTSCQGFVKGPKSRGLVQSHSDRTNPIIQRAFGKWARARANPPFLAFVHMWDVHFDYIPPPRYVEMFDPGYDGAVDGRKIAKTGFPLKLGRRDLAHMLARYDGEIRYTDDTLAELLKALDEAGHLDDTLVIVTADHGEEFLEHGGKGHQRTLYEEVTRVPLVLWAKDGLPRGRVIKTAVSLEDVTPTILDLLGVEHSSAEIDGVSLAPLWRGDAAPTRTVVGMLYTDNSARVKEATIRNGTRKVTRGAGPDSWVGYDLELDPTEQNPMPVAADDPLRTELAKQRSARIKALHELRSARNTAAPSVPEHVEKQLRELGYID